MPFNEKFEQEKPWAILGWTRKQWKAQKMWKKAGVSEEKMTQFLQCLDHATIREIKDQVAVEALIENVFGKEKD